MFPINILSCKETGPKSLMNLILLKGELGNLFFLALSIKVLKPFGLVTAEISS